MIVHESAYKHWLQRSGVGKKDQVADSRASYVSYLRSVSNILGEDVSPATISSHEALERIFRRLTGARSPNTLRNYRSALRQYLAMVEARAHP